MAMAVRISNPTCLLSKLKNILIFLTTGNTCRFCKLKGTLIPFMNSKWHLGLCSS
jgi:hypothetical protein